MCLCVGLGLSVFVVVESGFPPVLLMLFFFPLDIISIYGAHGFFVVVMFGFPYLFASFFSWKARDLKKHCV